MKDLLLQTVIQSRKGSIEYSDLAKSAGKITRSSAAYAGDQADTQRRLLGLAEVGMRTTGSPEEAATALSNLSADAGKHRDKVEALLGGRFVDEKGRVTRGPDEFIADLLKASGGNLSKLQDAGFGQRSQKLFQALAPVFNEAESRSLASGASKKEAREAGRAAVLRDIQDVTGGKYGQADLEADFANVMKTSAEKFEGAVRTLKEALADQLLPELVKLVPVLQQATPVLSDFLAKMVALANWAQENPIKAAVATLGVSITKEVMGQIVAAKIGETIKAMLVGGGGGAPGVSGLVGAGGGLAAGTGGALGIGLAAQGAAAYDLYSKAKDAADFGTAKGNALAQITSSGTAEERAMAQSEIGRASQVASAGTFSMWADRINKGAAILNPATLLGAYASDTITEGLGFKSEAQRSGETQTAASEVAAYEKMQSQLAKQTDLQQGMAASLRAIAAQGGGGSGGVNQAARTKSMLDR